jgi:hypothetical protein
VTLISVSTLSQNLKFRSMNAGSVTYPAKPAQTEERRTNVQAVLTMGTYCRLQNLLVHMKEPVFRVIYQISTSYQSLRTFVFLVKRQFSVELQTAKIVHSTRVVEEFYLNARNARINKILIMNHHLENIFRLTKNNVFSAALMDNTQITGEGASHAIQPAQSAIILKNAHVVRIKQPMKSVSTTKKNAILSSASI